MTATQKSQILHMRLMGSSYGQIAQDLGLSLNTIKSFCRRNNLGERKSENVIRCAYCGTEVMQTKHRKAKKFCSDSCRMHWWKEHRQMLNRKSRAAFRCLLCGGEFLDYRSTGRKYCSHACYIADRFGGAEV